MKLWNFIKKLIQSDSKESSKRFIAIFTSIQIAYIVVRYTSPENIVAVLTVLCGFVLSLAGVGAYLAGKKITHKGTEISEENEQQDNTDY